MERIQRINSISDVTKTEPFLSDKKVTSIIDIDGVLCEYGRRNNADDNVSRFLGLRKIISGSEKVVFNSSRINLDEEEVFNKLNKKANHRFFHILNRNINDESKFSFEDVKKAFSRNDYHDATIKERTIYAKFFQLMFTKESGPSLPMQD